MPTCLGDNSESPGQLGVAPTREDFDKPAGTSANHSAF